MPHSLVRPDGGWMRDVLSDEEVVRRVLDGEPELFELIVRRHNQRLFRTIRGLVAGDEEAEEVLQRAYVRAWARLHTWSGQAPLVAWLSRVAAREAGNLRRSERLRLGHTTERATQAPTSTVRSPIDDAAQQELQARVDEAVAALPQDYRSVFVLRVTEQLPTAEVAATLRLSDAAVKVRLHRARVMLREILGAVAVAEARFERLWQFDGERCDRVVAGVMARCPR